MSLPEPGTILLDKYRIEHVVAKGGHGCRGAGASSAEAHAVGIVHRDIKADAPAGRCLSVTAGVSFFITGPQSP